MPMCLTKKEFSLCLVVGENDIIRDLFRVFRAENILCINCQQGKLHLIHHGRNNRRTHSSIDKTLKKLEKEFQEKSHDDTDVFVKIDIHYNGYAKTFDGSHQYDPYFSMIFSTNQRVCKKSTFRYELQPGVKRYLSTDFQDVIENINNQDDLPDDITILRRRVLDGVDLQAKLCEELKNNARLIKEMDVIRKQICQCEDEKIEAVMSIENVIDRLLKFANIAGVDCHSGDNYKTIWKRVALAVHPDKVKCPPGKIAFFEKLGKAFTRLPSNI